MADAAKPAVQRPFSRLHRQAATGPDTGTDSGGPPSLRAESGSGIGSESVARKLEISRCYQALDQAEEEHRPAARFALFSGGHDSLANTSVCMEWAEKRGVEMKVAHIATGIGIPQTFDFVKEVCADQNWELVVYGGHGHSYEQIVRAHGFPGPAMHNRMYNQLKERNLRALVRDHKSERGDRVMLCSGVRKEESERRFLGAKDVFGRREGAIVWANPILEWSKRDCANRIEAEGLPRNPVVDLIHKSGECLCGAFARKGEMQELEMWFPEVADRIHVLEVEVEAAGRHGCVWGYRPPRVHRDQMKLGPLCSSCVQEEAA